MGVCTSAERDEEAAVHPERSEGNTIVLIGPAKSGKSTLFKQLILNFGEGFSVEDRKSYSDAIRCRTLEYMQQLIQENEKLLSEGDSEHRESSKVVLGQDPYQERINVLRSSVAKHVDKLWATPAIQATFELKDHFQKRLNENANHFLSQASKIGEDNYIPSVEDIMRCRQRTIGNTDNKFSYEGIDFTVYDLGGQWDERRHWHQFIARASTIVFMVNMAGYDEALHEDRKINCMEDASTLFARLSGASIYRDIPIVVFFNKMDVFRSKIKRIPLTQCPLFEDFDGAEGDVDAAAKNIQTHFDSCKFASQGKFRRSVKYHFLCALDIEAVKTIFNSVMTHVLKQQLLASGLSL
eukprot:jgi/Bigna1/56365/estExt_Genewise1Plus.C_960028